MNRHYLTTLVVIPIAVVAAGLCHSQPPKADASQGVKRNRSGHVVRLSIDCISIEISDDELPFTIENIDRSFDSKRIIRFLTAYYGKKTRKNDILVRSATKRLVKGEEAFEKALLGIGKKHGINVVYLPAAAGENPNTSLQAFSRTFER